MTIEQLLSPAVWDHIYENRNIPQEKRLDEFNKWFADNIELVNAKLTKEYTIYKIVENNVTKNYALTLDQAQLIVVKLRNKANKATAITIEPIITIIHPITSSSICKLIAFSFIDFGVMSP